MQEPRTVVITGGASGIGRRAAVQLTTAGHHAVVVARSAERARRVVDDATAAARHGGSVTLVEADLAVLADVRRAVDRIAALAPIAALINNAATFDLARSSARLTADDIEETFAVNYVAPFVLTNGLRPCLSAEAMVLNIGSKGLQALPRLRLGPDDLDSRANYDPIRAYYRSKIALLAFTVELGRRGLPSVALRMPGVKADPSKTAHYPLYLKVPYGLKAIWALDPATVAGQYLTLTMSPRPPHSRHLDDLGRTVPWPNGSEDPDLGSWLWDRTAALAAVGPRSPP